MPKAKARLRNERLKRLYGITSKQWDKMFQHQQGLCPICLKPILKYGNKEGKLAAAVDHCHKTKRVRGLLHFRCNKYYVGRMTTELSRRVTTYLESDFDARNL